MKTATKLVETDEFLKLWELTDTMKFSMRLKTSHIVFVNSDMRICIVLDTTTKKSFITSYETKEVIKFLYTVHREELDKLIKRIENKCSVGTPAYFEHIVEFAAEKFIEVGLINEKSMKIEIDLLHTILKSLQFVHFQKFEYLHDSITCHNLLFGEKK